jgi:hypothetical protein
MGSPYERLAFQSSAVDARPQKMKLCPFIKRLLLDEWESMKANHQQFSLCFLSEIGPPLTRYPAQRG